MSELTNLAFEQAEAILTCECSPIGPMASPRGHLYGLRGGSPPAKAGADRVLTFTNQQRFHRSARLAGGYVGLIAKHSISGG